LPSQKLLGRQHHVSEIDLLVDAALAGRGNLLLISGEAGIGKTRLAEEAALMAGRKGVSTAWAMFGREAGRPPFWPWVEILGQIRDLVDNSSGRAERISAELDRLRPGPHALPIDVPDPEIDRFLLFDSIASALRSSLSEGAVLAVMDDLHWADAASIQLLAYLSTRLRTMPLLLIATYRTEEPGEELFKRLPDLLRHGRSLILPPLGRDEVAELALSAGFEVDAPTITELMRRSRGNPLYALELIRYEMGTSTADAENSGLSRSVPMTIRAAFEERLATISAEARAILEMASVLGFEFDVDQLSEAAGADTKTCLEHLDEATRAGLVVALTDNRYSFRHPLVCETIYSGLTAAHRVALHVEAGEALERMAQTDRNVSPAELAHHFTAASASGKSVARKALGYAKTAAEDAMRLYAYESAASYLESALRLADLSGETWAERVELTLALGESHLAAGNVEESRIAFRSAARLAQNEGGPGQLAAAALGLGSGRIGFEVPMFDREQIDLLREALVVLGDSAPGDRARLMARLSIALSLTGSYDERRSLSEESLRTARESDDSDALAQALSAHCDVIAGPGFVEERLREADEIISIASSHRDIRTELLGRRHRIVALLEMGAMSDVDREISEFSRAADSIRQPLFSWYPILWRGMRQLMAGQVDQAKVNAARVDEIADATGSSNARLLAVSLAFNAARAEGDYAGMRDILENALGRASILELMLIPLQALSKSSTGETAAARKLIDEISLDAFSVEELGSEWLPEAVYLADAIWMAGGHSIGTELRLALEPYHHLYAIDGIGAANLGSVARSLGLLAALDGEIEDAKKYFDEALAANRHIASPLLVAQTTAEAGLACGDRDLLSEGRKLYSELGLNIMASHVDELADAFGVGGSIDSHRSSTTKKSERDSQVRRSGVMKDEGDFWVLSFDEKTVRVKCTKGLRDLARMLREPNREFHALDLMSAESTRQRGGGISGEGDTGEVIDEFARDSYKRRLIELESEIGEADESGDIVRVEQLQLEKDAILAELSAAYGLGGRARKTGSAAERARSAVTQRIRDAISRIEAIHSELGRHLDRSVRTGTYCSYDPETPVDWEF
jgi:tetratricopeptide (TPR) repeat protein